MTSKLFTFKDVKKTYKKNKVEKIAINIPELTLFKEDTAILGVSGSGKSSLLFLLGLMSSADETSEITYYQGEDDKIVYCKKMSDKQKRQLRSQNFGFIFQDSYLFSHLPSKYNVSISSWIWHNKNQQNDYELQLLELFREDFYVESYPKEGIENIVAKMRNDMIQQKTPLSCKTRLEVKEANKEWILTLDNKQFLIVNGSKTTDVYDYGEFKRILNSKPRSLSGGQQQRLAIGRALYNRPKVIFADEPTGNLDPKNARSIMNILKKQTGNDTNLILITHDFEIAYEYCERYIFLKNGRIAGDHRKLDGDLKNGKELYDLYQK